MPSLRSLVAMLVAAVALALPAGAEAATVSVLDGALTVTAMPGEANRLTLTPGVGGVDVLDPSAALTPGAGCVTAGSGRLACTVPALPRVVVELGDMDDTLVVSGLLPLVVADGAGNDTITGGAGDDEFVAGLGADSYAGGPGSDRVDYGARATNLTIDLDDVADDGAGENDNVRRDIERVRGGAGNDTITGWTGADWLDGAAGNDTLLGGSGNDRLDGALGDDSLQGQTGTDKVDYSARSEAVLADLEAAAGGATGERDMYSGVEDAAGGAGADRLVGNASANVLEGGLGDDVFDGGSGADTIDGGAGTDTVDYGTRTAAVTVDLDGSGDDGASNERDNVKPGVERVLGGSAGDTLAGDGLANTLVGNGGNDRLTGNGGDDTLDGGTGNDTLDGSSGDDALDGGTGNDSLKGSDGNDALGDGTGDDQAWGGTGNDTLVLGDGADKAWGEAGDDRLDGGTENDALYGGDGDDTLADAAGDNRLEGGNGVDTLSAGDGVDRLYGGAGADTLNGAGGNDLLDGGADGDGLAGGAGDDELDGGPANDRLEGGDGADDLDGGDGDDGLDGGVGNDSLDGDGGNDVLTDPEGADVLTGDSGEDRLDAGPGDDRLYGGDGADALAASDGNDELRGDGGADRLDGGPGTDGMFGGNEDDVLSGGAGADRLDGEGGRDTADYAARTAPLTIDTDGQADDGERNEGDNVLTETVIGGAGADKLTGGSADNQLYGERGDDTLRGGDGTDALYGGDGKDRLYGEKGTDTLDGAAGDDRLDARDGLRELVLCGAGKDEAWFDTVDRATGCETKHKSSGATETAPVGLDTSAPAGVVAGVSRVTTRGRFVAIPGFPGEKIDSRLLADLAYLVRKYHVRVTDGFALHGHQRNGEHPIGLAVDLVPGAGGSWDDIDKLARWAEPRQNRPRAPFRWVGYNGDANHGRGNHLHLSWLHSATKRGRPASVVYRLSVRKPAAPATASLASVARRSNHSLGRKPSIRSGLSSPGKCAGAAALKPIFQSAAKAFGLRWTVLAGLTEVESGHGCNMGPSSAGAIGWTQFMPATWKEWGMDAGGDGKADPYDAVDAIYSSARYLRASGAPGSYRKALYAYNHAWWYVDKVLKAAKRYR